MRFRPKNLSWALSLVCGAASSVWRGSQKFKRGREPFVTSIRNQLCKFEWHHANGHKKSSQKSTRPRGAKDVDTFPGAIGRNNACSQALCIEAVEGVRAYQPLRDRPSQASRPTTWDSSFRRKKSGGLSSTFAASLPACVLPTRLFIRCAGRIGPLQNTVKVGFKSLQKSFWSI
jgi:hypothetical protein